MIRGNPRAEPTAWAAVSRRGLPDPVSSMTASIAGPTEVLGQVFPVLVRSSEIQTRAPIAHRMVVAHAIYRTVRDGFATGVTPGPH